MVWVTPAACPETYTTPAPTSDPTSAPLDPALTVTVTSLADTGPGTLRAALMAGQLSLSPADQPLSVTLEVHGEVVLASPLPTVTRPLHLQRAPSAAARRLSLNGYGLSRASTAPGLQLSATAVDSRIEGLALRGFPRHGLESAADSLRVDDCVFEDNGGAGIRTQNSRGVVVDRCTVARAGTIGLDLADCHGCSVSHTLVNGSQTGIQLTGSSSATLIRATTVLQSLTHGIYITGSSSSAAAPTRIENCVVRGATNWYGIYVNAAGAQHTLLLRNTSVAETKRSGVHLLACSHCRVDRCTLSAIEQTALYFGGASRNISVTHTNIHDITGSGISFTSHSTAAAPSVVDSVLIERSGGAGVTADGQNIVVQSTTTNTTGSYGLQLLSCAHCRIHRCSVLNVVGSYGVRLYALEATAGVATIADTTIAGTSDTALWMFSSVSADTPLVVTNTSVVDTGSNGVFATGSHITLRNLSVSFSSKTLGTESGVQFHTCEDCHLHASTITDASGRGIALLGPSRNNTITDCFVARTRGSGIAFSRTGLDAYNGDWLTVIANNTIETTVPAGITSSSAALSIYTGSTYPGGTRSTYDIFVEHNIFRSGPGGVDRFFVRIDSPAPLLLRHNAFVGPGAHVLQPGAPIAAIFLSYSYGSSTTSPRRSGPEAPLSIGPGNHFIDMPIQVIDARQSMGARITGNTFGLDPADPSTPRPNAAGLILWTDAREGAIADNILAHAGGAAIALARSTALLVQRNTIFSVNELISLPSDSSRTSAKLAAPVLGPLTNSYLSGSTLVPAPGTITVEVYAFRLDSSLSYVVADVCATGPTAHTASWKLGLPALHARANISTTMPSFPHTFYFSFTAAQLAAGLPAGANAFVAMATWEADTASAASPPPFTEQLTSEFSGCVLQTANVVRDVCLAGACTCNADHTAVDCSDRELYIGLQTLSFPPGTISLNLQNSFIGRLLPQQFVGRLNRLRILNLSNARLYEEDPTPILATLPALEDLDLSGNGLTSLDHHTTALDEVRAWQDDARTNASIGPFRRLKHLRLANNSITSIFSGMLAQASDLETLDLAGNALTGLEPLLSAGKLGSLTVLDLSYNALERVAVLGSNMSRLAMLDLSHNAITEVDSGGAFLGQHLLQQLDLSHNQLARLGGGGGGGRRAAEEETGAFSASANPVLAVVDVSWNMLSEAEIAYSGLTRVPALQTLLLHHNNIGTISSPLTAPSTCLFPVALPHISAMDLAYNAITAIYANGLSSLTHIKSLALQHNRLALLSDTSLAGLNRLETLDMTSQDPASPPADPADFVGFQFVGLSSLLYAVMHVKGCPSGFGLGIDLADAPNYCLPCPAGYYLPPAGGLLSNCQVCPAGFSDHDRDAATPCAACVAGQYAAAASTGACVLMTCEAGTSDEDRDPATPCVECPAGGYVPRNSTTPCASQTCLAGSTDHDFSSATPCLACGPGTFVGPAQTGLCEAYLCAAGWVDADADAATPCVACGAGNFVPAGSFGPCSDFACAEGTFDDDNSAATSCVPTSAGAGGGAASGSGSGSNTAVLAGAGAGVALIALIAILVARHRVRRRLEMQRWEVEEMKKRVAAVTTALLPNDSVELSSRLKLLEVTRTQLVLGDMLGEGEFGEVHKGRLVATAPRTRILSRRGQGHAQREEGADGHPGRGEESGGVPVAVKQLKGSTDKEEQERFLVEAFLTAMLTHESIVKVVGVCTMDPPFMVALEYLPGGNLRDYLRKCAKQGQAPKRSASSRVSTTASALSSSGGTLIMNPAFTTDMETVLEEVTMRDLLGAWHQLTGAMAHLEASGVVHRDLAARNVLVGRDLSQVKLADFGMARAMEEKDYYRKTSDDKVPVKWMAPESIQEKVYTHKTDVWSFGVLMWEIYSFGEAPFRQLTAVETAMVVGTGRRLPRPKACPRKIFSTMLRMWSLDPASRPGFDDLRALATQLLAEAEDDGWSSAGASGRPSLDQSSAWDTAEYATATAEDETLGGALGGTFGASQLRRLDEETDYDNDMLLTAQLSNGGNADVERVDNSGNVGNRAGSLFGNVEASRTLAERILHSQPRGTFLLRRLDTFHDDEPGMMPGMAVEEEAVDVLMLSAQVEGGGRQSPVLEEHGFETSGAGSSRVLHVPIVCRGLAETDGGVMVVDSCRLAEGRRAVEAVAGEADGRAAEDSDEPETPVFSSLDDLVAHYSLEGGGHSRASSRAGGDGYVTLVDCQELSSATAADGVALAALLGSGYLRLGLPARAATMVDADQLDKAATYCSLLDGDAMLDFQVVSGSK